ncbi:MAG: POTRA domain-containing protein [Planctomycetaceae bacterium]
MVGVKDDTGFRKLLTNRNLSSLKSRFIPVACLVLIICLLSAYTAAPACAQASRSPGSGAVPLKDRTENNLSKVSNRAYNDRLDQPVIEIRVEGNTTIPQDAILRKINTQIDRKPSQKMIRKTFRSCTRLAGSSVSPPNWNEHLKGLILTFVVTERPIVDKISYQGNEKIKDKVLAEITGLREGSPYDVSANLESAQRLESYYKEKGFFFAEVTLISGDKPEQRDVIFKIVEGKKTRVQKVYFEGNEFVADGVLKTHLSTKRAILWKFGGLYDPSSIQNDLNALKQYYTNYGYFDVAVDHRVEFNEKKDSVYIYYDINEGDRYKIRKRIIEGNEVLTTKQITDDMELGEKEYFNARILGNDIRELKAKYGAQGRFFATVDASPVFLETPGLADLKYEIEEDEIYTIRNINVHILGDYPHTKETVALNRMRVQPGDLADPRMIRLSETRLGGSQIFERTGATAPRITVQPVTPADGGVLDPDLFRGQSEELPYERENRSTRSTNEQFQKSAPDQSSYRLPRPAGEAYRLTRNEYAARQGDSFNSINNSTVHTETLQTLASQTQSPKRISATEVFGQSTGFGQSDLGFGHSGIPSTVSQEVLRPQSAGSATGNLAFHEASANVETESFNKETLNEELEMIFRGQSPEPQFDPVFDPNVEQSQFVNPYNPLTEGVTQGDPLQGSMQQRQVDIDTYLTEARTGSFMFGVGVNSDSGLAGNIVLQEQNFDIMRPPTSFQDIVNGTAWRGAGQKFRLEAVPGTEIGRYTASWSDPHFLDTDYSFGVSGFYFTRFYPDWDEQRTGGRFTLGKQLTPEWSISGAFRLEDIEIDSPSIPTPQELADALGNSLLTTFKATLTHDTRDAPFMPN